MWFKYLGKPNVKSLPRKVTLPQLKKYDVSQKVLEALADAESRAILFSIIKTGKTAMELAQKHRIPLSTVYKKLGDLEGLTLVFVDKWKLSDKGRRFKVYKSRISKAYVTIQRPEPKINLYPN